MIYLVGSKIRTWEWKLPDCSISLNINHTLPGECAESGYYLPRCSRGGRPLNWHHKMIKNAQIYVGAITQPETCSYCAQVHERVTQVFWVCPKATEHSVLMMAPEVNFRDHKNDSEPAWGEHECVPNTGIAMTLIAVYLIHIQPITQSLFYAYNTSFSHPHRRRTREAGNQTTDIPI